jgi:predicted DNA-binding protein (MmcQ/YjbR family)
MNIEELRDHCIAKPGVEECFPFDEETLAFKVMGKIFLLTNIHEHPLSFNAKCDPEKAVELRENYSCVQPGYHMNKKHWNTITCQPNISAKLIKGWIDHSYDLVASALPKKLKEELKSLK